MKTFKNLDAIKGEFTTAFYCESEVAPIGNWVECDPIENNKSHLFTQAGVRYFGCL